MNPWSKYANKQKGSDDCASNPTFVQINGRNGGWLRASSRISPKLGVSRKPAFKPEQKRRLQRLVNMEAGANRI